MERVRAGLIGAGGMANAVHYPSLAEFSDVELVALCDLVPEKREKTAERFGIPKTYGDYREMLDCEEVDAVWVLMPPHHLFDIVIQCVKRKKHVFIEKPPGITYDQARMMGLACEQQGVLGMCGFNRRYIPLIQKCRERVDARGGVIQCVSTFYKFHVGGRAYYEGAIDILSCDAVHAVDMLRYMGGEPAHVAAHVTNRGNAFDDSFNALVQFEGGATGVLLANWCVGARTHSFEMHGMGISCFINPDRSAEIYVDGKGEPEVITTQEAAGSDQRHHFYGFAGENRHFVDCIREGRSPDTSLADAARTMRLVNEIYASPVDGARGRWPGR
ncbi:MAG: Gfo/Idh/MocA family oxidoreductase [Armatimonadetes bacterium]|nr:Gfo/Idh/MocA family oxidoreductase [Armatimonadota bacterium]